MTTETISNPAKYQIMPPLSEEENAALEKSIAEKGVLTTIVVDEDGNIIDGHHRDRIARKLGVPCPRDVKAFLNDTEKLGMALSLNIARRHLTREQRRELVEKSIKADPPLSDREHARRTGVSDKTAGAVRKDLEANAEIPHNTDRKEASGRTARGVKTKPRHNAAAQPESSTNNDTNGTTAANDEATPNPKANIADELDDITSGLKRVRRQIGKQGERVVSLRKRDDYGRDIERELIIEAAELIDVFRTFGEKHSDDTAAEIADALIQAGLTLKKSVQDRRERQAEADTTTATN